jgi:hypothetical protein
MVDDCLIPCPRHRLHPRPTEQDSAVPEKRYYKSKATLKAICSISDTFQREKSVKRSCASNEAVVEPIGDGEEGGGVPGYGSMSSTDGLGEQKLGGALEGWDRKLCSMLV